MNAKLFLFFVCTSLILFSLASASTANATSIIDFSHDDLALHADLVFIGTVKSQWFDFRPFDDMPLIDTVKIQPDEWLKNNHDIDSEVEIRYYGKWAKIADELRARGMGSAAFQPEFKIGEKMLLFLAKEKPGMYMGEGYYSFGYQGKYSINDKGIAQNREPEKTISMDEIRKIIFEQLIQIQKDINSDDILISRTTSDITDMFLEKYPDAEIFVNRDGDELSVNYRAYLDSANRHEMTNTDKLPFLLLKIQFDKSGLRDDQYLECWDGGKSSMLKKPGHIRESIGNQFCEKMIS